MRLQLVAERLQSRMDTASWGALGSPTPKLWPGSEVRVGQHLCVPALNVAEKNLDSGFKHLWEAAREEPRCSNIFQQGPGNLGLKNVMEFKDLQLFRDPTKDKSEGICPTSPPQLGYLLPPKRPLGDLAEVSWFRGAEFFSKRTLV